MDKIAKIYVEHINPPARPSIERRLERKQQNISVHTNFWQRSIQKLPLRYLSDVPPMRI